MSAFGDAPTFIELNKTFIERCSISDVCKSFVVQGPALSEALLQQRVQEAWKLIPRDWCSRIIPQTDLNETLVTIEKYKDVLRLKSASGNFFVVRSPTSGFYRTVYVDRFGNIHILIKERFWTKTSETMMGVFKTVCKVITIESSELRAYASTKIAKKIDLIRMTMTEKPKLESSCINEEVFGIATKGVAHVVQYEDVVYYRNKGVPKQGILMPFYNGGDLVKYIKDNPESKHDHYRIALGVIRGLSGIHKKGIFHRDIKPENIMLHRAVSEEKSETLTSIIIDGGLSLRMCDKELWGDMPGPKGYRPVEVIRYLNEGFVPAIAECLEQITTATEVYALGIVFGELFFKMEPKLINDQLNPHYRFWKEPDRKVKKLDHLIWSMTRDDHEQRPTVAEIEQRLVRIMHCEGIAP